MNPIICEHLCWALSEQLDFKLQVGTNQEKSKSSYSLCKNCFFPSGQTNLTEQVTEIKYQLSCKETDKVLIALQKFETA